MLLDGTAMSVAAQHLYIGGDFFEVGQGALDGHGGSVPAGAQAPPVAAATIRWAAKLRLHASASM